MFEFVKYVEGMIAIAEDNGQKYIHFLSPFAYETYDAVEELRARGFNACAKVDTNDDEYIYIKL